MATQTMTDDKNNPNALNVDDGYSIFKYVLIGALVIILGVVAYNVYQNNQEASFAEMGDNVYKFEETHFNPALEKKGDADFSTLINEFGNLFSHPASKQGALSVESIKVADFLIANDKAEEAKNILNRALKFADSDFARHFIISRLGVLEQNAGNVEGAISLYESLLKQKMTVMEDKVYLQLGVLYAKKGNKEKAKASLNYVVEKSKDETLLKIARLYLGEM